MLANEMRDQFMVQYEKITANGAPGIEDSDLSLLITNAQLLFVLSRISKISNAKQQGFEETEIRMQGLSGLIKDSALSSVIQSISTENLENGRFWDLPRDFMYSILEQAYIDKLDCSKYYTQILGNWSSLTNYVTNDIVYYLGSFYIALENNYNIIPDGNEDEWKKINSALIPVKVITHNEINYSKNNPYKKPYFNGTNGLVWRLAYKRNVSGYNSNTLTTIDGVSYIQSQTPKLHELFTDGTFNVVGYKLRYLKYPRNIVIDTNTLTNQRHCELDEVTHPVIIDLAVKLAQQALDNPTQDTVLDLPIIE